MKSLLYVLVTTLTLLSCGAQKNTATPVDTNSPVENKDFFTTIKKKSDFTQVKINSKIDAETESYVPTIDATIYIENGSKIWMNMSAMFINVARGIATQDGIKAYEKWNKTYIESDFSYLNNLLNVNFINYEALQNLLVGKAFLPISETDYVLTKNAQGHTIKTKNKQKVTVNGKTAEYDVTMDYNPSLDLNRVYLSDNAQNQLEVLYTDWLQVENQRFPKNVKIIIKGQKNGQILIENTKFDFSKMEVPFSIPDNYTKKNIK